MLDHDVLLCWSRTSTVRRRRRRREGSLDPVARGEGPWLEGLRCLGESRHQQSYDVVVVGGGHNALVSAAYLARAGLSVVVLERLDHTGGAAVSVEPFSGHPARLSRYSYLVSLMPEQLMADLGLDVRLASRTTASYTPWLRGDRSGGLLVERPEGEATRASFRDLTGGDEEYAAWQAFYGEVGRLAEVVAPTLMQPLPLERERPRARRRGHLGRRRRAAARAARSPRGSPTTPSAASSRPTP